MEISWKATCNSIYSEYWTRFHCEFYFVVSTSISHWFVNWIYLWVISMRFQGNIFQINLIFFGIFNKCFSFCHNWFVMPLKRSLFLSTALSLSLEIQIQVISLVENEWMDLVFNFMEMKSIFGGATKTILNQVIYLFGC